jgi:hypothetical protein
MPSEFTNPSAHPENSLLSLLGHQENRSILFQRPSSFLYHYADIATFWKLIDEEILRAGNIRFSNDTQELEIGMELAERCSGQKFDHGATRLGNFFVTCFSEYGDQRSQWSEYCRGTLGVSIGFDFSGNLPFEKREESTWPDVYGKIACDCFGHNCFAIVSDAKPESPFFYAIAPYKVIYVANKNKKGISSKSLVYDKDPYVYTYIPPAYNKKPYVYTDRQIKKDIRKGHEFPFDMNLLIPYIKHPAFVEEGEYRLVFDMTPYKHLVEKFEDYLWYVDECYKHIPGLKIKYRLPHDIDFSNNGYLKFQYGNVLPIISPCKIEEIPGVITKFLKDHNDAFDKQLNITIPQCGEQREIFKKVEKHLKKHCKEHADNVSLKIWCEGHLPIRKIIVERGHDTELIVESIQTYLKTKYWLNYVDVSQSQIPYRKR